MAGSSAQASLAAPSHTSSRVAGRGFTWWIHGRPGAGPLARPPACSPPTSRGTSPPSSSSASGASPPTGYAKGERRVGYRHRSARCGALQVAAAGAEAVRTWRPWRASSPTRAWCASSSSDEVRELSRTWRTCTAPSSFRRTVTCWRRRSSNPSSPRRRSVVVSRPPPSPRWAVPPRVAVAPPRTVLGDAAVLAAGGWWPADPGAHRLGASPPSARPAVRPMSVAALRTRLTPAATVHDTPAAGAAARRARPWRLLVLALPRARRARRCCARRSRPTTRGRGSSGAARSRTSTSITTTGPSWKPLPVHLHDAVRARRRRRRAAAVAAWSRAPAALLAFAMAYRLGARLAGPVGGRDRRAARCSSPTSSSATSSRGNSEGILVALVPVGDRAPPRRPPPRRVPARPRRRAAAARGVAVHRALRAVADAPTDAARRRTIALVLGGGARACGVLWFVPEYLGSGDFLRAAARARQPNPDSRRVRRRTRSSRSSTARASVLIAAGLRRRADRARARVACVERDRRC